MDFAAIQRWWSVLAKPRHARRPGEPDRGDMGTAFGLDASLESAQHDPLGFETQPGVWALSWEERAARRGL